jgi:excisionase family DNA binding protein
MRQLISIQQAASALGISPDLLRKIIARQELEVVRVGRRVLLDAYRVDQYIVAHTTRGGAIPRPVTGGGKLDS